MPDHFYVYPAYLAAGATRRGGRRVPAASSVKGEISLDQMAEAARALGYEVEVEEGKSYPRTFWQGSGRLKVQKKGTDPKTAFVRRLAQELQRRSPTPPARSA